MKFLSMVTDRSPFISGCGIDFSYGLAKKLFVVEIGGSKLLMRVL